MYKQLLLLINNNCTICEQAVWQQLGLGEAKACVP